MVYGGLDVDNLTLVFIGKGISTKDRETSQDIFRLKLLKENYQKGM